MEKRSLYVFLAGIAIFLVMFILPDRVQHKGTLANNQEFQDQVAFDKVASKLVVDTRLSSEGWDTLAQPAFWQKAMVLSPDSSLVNIAATRQIITTIHSDLYFQKTKKERESYKDSLRTLHGLGKKDEIYITTGKSHFYRFGTVIPNIIASTTYFKEESVDPWFAQAILLIESPNQLQASPVGAFGPFQLMPGVAREHGLTVNKKVDERADLEKSARGAASLLKKVCIPGAETILKKFDIPYDQKETWFKLMVLHVYHAGQRNVAGAMRKLKPKKGGMELIQGLWQTEYRGFRNASQNYSQVALASMLTLAQMLESEKLPEEAVGEPSH